MTTALKFSYKEKLLKKKEYCSILKHIKDSKLPSQLKNYFSLKDLNKMLSFMIKDKKNNSNKINLILLKKIGSTISDKKYHRNYLKIFLKNELNNQNL